MQFKKPAVKILLLAVTLLAACNFSSTYLNRENDIEEGKKFVSTFYSTIKSQDANAINKMASDTLAKMMGPGGLNKLTTLINTKVGAYKSYTVTQSDTRAITGSFARTEYKFRLKVIYEKGPVDEELGFMKTGNGETKIYAYHTFSDLLMK
jgi:hypothetical protein